LAGADLTIYPRFDARYLMSREECQNVAATSREPWEHIQPTMPAVGGRMGVEQIAELCTELGPDIVFVLGSRIQQDERGVVEGIEEFHRRLRDAL
jgi:ribulose 1,5-bisphosphate carboxylase large subunit-like protein